MANGFADEFKDQCLLRIGESADRIERCVKQLNEDELWRRPNSQLVSVANLVLHLCGNITQYIICSLGGVPSRRDRDKEFTADKSQSAKELLSLFSNTIARAKHIIAETPESELMRIRTVQGFTLSGTGVIVHVTEHLSYHTGQIALHTKLLREKDLGFYEGLDLNQ